jgi:pimeloyl-ACP methyl ester carboxylesterase
MPRAYQPTATEHRAAAVVGWSVPFRIKVSLWILATLALIALVGPLVVPIAPLADTTDARDLAWPGSAWTPALGLDVHVEAVLDGAPVTDLAALPSPAAAPVLLLHGFGANTRSWGATLPWIGEAPETAGDVAMAYDRPGFGLTDRPTGGWAPDANPYGPDAQVATAVALIDALGAEAAVLVGHSAGGAIALQTALAHPDRVAALVLVAPAVYRGGGAPAWSKPLLRTPQLERIGPVLMRQLGGRTGDDFLRSSWADPTRMDDAVFEAYRRPLRAHDWDRALWELVKASAEPDLADRLAEVRVPVLVVHGLQDVVVPIEQSRDLIVDLANVPGGARLVELDGCGHLPHEECPEAFRAAVESWWNDRAAAAVRP